MCTVKFFFCWLSILTFNCTSFYTRKQELGLFLQVSVFFSQCFHCNYNFNSCSIYNGIQSLHVGMTAPQAAGVIHSDFQKGFIRAETVSCVHN
jgi:hypothetical protein